MILGRRECREEESGLVDRESATLSTGVTTVVSTPLEYTCGTTVVSLTSTTETPEDST